MSRSKDILSLAELLLPEDTSSMSRSEGWQANVSILVVAKFAFAAGLPGPLQPPLRKTPPSPLSFWQRPLLIRSFSWPCCSLQSFTQHRTATASVLVILDTKLDLKTSVLPCDAGCFSCVLPKDAQEFFGRNCVHLRPADSLRRASWWNGRARCIMLHILI